MTKDNHEDLTSTIKDLLKIDGFETNAELME